MSQLSTDYLIQDCTKKGADLLLKSMQQEIIESNLAMADEYYLAIQEQRLVGVIGIKPKNHLYHLFVDQSLHNQGVGRSLWEKVISQQPNKSATFTVNSSMHAIGFYLKLGFIASSAVVVKNGIPSIPMKICTK